MGNQFRPGFLVLACLCMVVIIIWSQHPSSIEGAEMTFTITRTMVNYETTTTTRTTLKTSTSTSTVTQTITTTRLRTSTTTPTLTETVDLRQTTTYHIPCTETLTTTIFQTSPHQTADTTTETSMTSTRTTQGNIPSYPKEVVPLMILIAVIVGIAIVLFLRKKKRIEPSQVASEKPHKFCINCGKSLPPDSKYCKTCGEKQE